MFPNGGNALKTNKEPKEQNDWLSGAILKTKELLAKKTKINKLPAPKNFDLTDDQYICQILENLWSPVLPPPSLNVSPDTVYAGNPEPEARLVFVLGFQYEHKTLELKVCRGLRACWFFRSDKEAGAFECPIDGPQRMLAWLLK